MNKLRALLDVLEGKLAASKRCTYHMNAEIASYSEGYEAGLEMVIHEIKETLGIK